MDIETRDKEIHFGIYRGYSYKDIIDNVKDASVSSILSRCRYEINLSTSMNTQVISFSKIMIGQLKQDFTLEEYPELWI